MAKGLPRYIGEQGEETWWCDCLHHKHIEFAMEVSKTVGEHRIKAYIFEELRSTPELSFAVRYLHVFTGVVISASHNLSEYNGLKLYEENGSQITPSATERISHYIYVVEVCLAS